MIGKRRFRGRRGLALGRQGRRGVSSFYHYSMTGDNGCKRQDKQ